MPDVAATLSVVISPEEHDRLRQSAKEEDRSVSAEARRAIRAYLDARDAPPAPQAPASA